MTWSTNTEPKKTGWYLVTTKGGTVMPVKREEYPKGNFYWANPPIGFIGDTHNIIAVCRFPKPYTRKEHK